MATRRLRALFLANDGLGAGHVVRTLAVARALDRLSLERGIELSALLSTSSLADELLASQSLPIVRVPPSSACGDAGLSSHEYQRLAAGVLKGAIEGFSPDVLVVDTFPSGPHLELRGALREVPCRVLIRRTVRYEASKAPEIGAGLSHYQRIIVPDDPTPLPLWGLETVEARCVRVLPITAIERGEMLTREQARAMLGLPSGKVALVVAGGGGDVEAARQLSALVPSLVRRGYVVVWARGPLSREAAPLGSIELRRCPIGPFLMAFDVAVSCAGYNSAHELAKAGVPTLLVPRARPFDDQEGRSSRFARLGIARVFDEAKVDEQLAELEGPPGGPAIAGGGAVEAAMAVLEAAGAA